MRGTGAFAVAMVAQRAIGFVLLPLYTRVLTPQEYGELAVLLTISAAAITVLSFGLETAIFRSYILLRGEPDEQKNFLNSVGVLALVAPITLAAITVLLLGSTMAELLSVSRSGFAIAMAAAAIHVSVTLVPFAILRAQERLGPFIRLTLLQVALTTGLTLLLVVVLDMGVEGWLGAGLLSVLTVLTFGMGMLQHRWSLSVDRHHIATALLFGLPLLPHAVAHWGLSLSDRVILGAFSTSAAVGQYFLAYNFALPISTLALAMTRGTSPLYAHATSSESDRAQLPEVITHQVVITVLTGLAVVVLGPPLIHLAMPSAYAQAAAFVPWLALGTALLGLYFIPMNVVSILAGNTRWVWTATVGAASVNVSLNLLTIPRLGPIAAAVNYSIGYAVLLVGVVIFMYRTRETIELEWWRISLAIGIVAAMGVCVILLTRELQPPAALALGVVALLATPLLLLLAGIWRRPVRGQATGTMAGDM